MARNYHIGMKKETTFGTYASATPFIPVSSWDTDLGLASEQGRHTGADRALRYHWNTIINPSLDVSGLWWSEYMGHLLRNLVQEDPTTTTPATATNTRLHVFKPGNASTLKGLSIEAQHTGAAAIFMQGGVVNSMDIVASGSAPIECNWSLLSTDMVRASGTWSDASAAPSVTGSPTYFASTIAPLMSWKTTVKIGGTVAVDGTTGYLTVTGGTANTSFKNYTLSINNNAEGVKTFNNQINPTTMHLGARDVTLELELDWETVSNTFWDAWLAGTAQVIEVIHTGAITEAALTYQMSFVIPNAKLDMANYPGATGAIERPTQPLTFIATEGADGYEFCIAVQDMQSGYN